VDLSNINKKGIIRMNKNYKIYKGYTIEWNDRIKRWEVYHISDIPLFNARAIKKCKEYVDKKGINK
jgi:hypothetical protein